MQKWWWPEHREVVTFVVAVAVDSADAVDTQTLRLVALVLDSKAAPKSHSEGLIQNYGTDRQHESTTTEKSKKIRNIPSQ